MKQISVILMTIAVLAFASVAANAAVLEQGTVGIPSLLGPELFAGGDMPTLSVVNPNFPLIPSKFRLIGDPGSPWWEDDGNPIPCMEAWDGQQVLNAYYPTAVPGNRYVFSVDLKEPTAADGGTYAQADASYVYVGVYVGGNTYTIVSLGINATWEHYSFIITVPAGASGTWYPYVMVPSVSGTDSRVRIDNFSLKDATLALTIENAIAAAIASIPAGLTTSQVQGMIDSSITADNILDDAATDVAIADDNTTHDDAAYAPIGHGHATSLPHVHDKGSGARTTGGVILTP